MARNARKKSESGFYHVMIRGIGKQILFEDGEDHIRFRETLKRCLGEHSVRIQAYCMMENHVHMLICDPKDELDLFMKKLEGSYAFYYNHKYERVGALFQDRYKSEPVETDAYFTVALRYILQNPQKAGIASAADYPWSSYRELTGRADIIDVETAVRFFGGKEQLLRAVSEPCTETCMEPSAPPVSDSRAKQIIYECLKLESGTQLQSFCQKDRDAALRVLKEHGLSVRQIERLTGINRGAVQKA